MAYARFTRSTDSDGDIIYTQTDSGSVALAAGSRDFMVANSLGTGIYYDLEADSFSRTREYLDPGEFRIYTTNVTATLSIEIFPTHETAAILRENASDPIESRTVFYVNV